jgi:predicted transcriptional regulator
MRRGVDDNQLDPRLRQREMTAATFDGLPLFRPEPPPIVPAARKTDPVTSHDAAASMLEAAGLQRRILVNLLRAHGPMTADELDTLADWRPTTAGRRLAECERLGVVQRTGATRPTRSGRAAEVWAAV